jgi:hypothetical protein
MGTDRWTDEDSNGTAKSTAADTTGVTGHAK